MFLIPFLDEIRQYIATAEFRQGVYVELAGMTIDIILLAALVPFAVWLVHLPKKRRAKSMASFYTLQFIRDCVLLLLKIGRAKNINELLNAELVAGRVNSLSAHPIYGNTADLFALLQQRMRDGSHVEGHKLIDEQDLAALRLSAADLLAKLDHYVFLFNSVNLPEFSEKFFDARLVLFPLKDYLESHSFGCDPKDFNSDPIRTISTVVASTFDKWFLSERAGPDRALKSKQRWSMLLLLMKLPFILVYRALVPTVLRFIGRPYIDPVASDFFPSMLRALVDNPNVGLDHLSDHVGMPKKTVKVFSCGYRQPRFEVQQAMLIKARELVDAEQWRALVVNQIFRDIARRKPSIVEFDSAKATAMIWFVTLVGGARSEDPGITRIFWKLFSLRPDDIDISFFATAKDAAFVAELKNAIKADSISEN